MWKYADDGFVVVMDVGVQTLHSYHILHSDKFRYVELISLVNGFDRMLYDSIAPDSLCFCILPLCCLLIISNRAFTSQMRLAFMRMNPLDDKYNN